MKVPEVILSMPFEVKIEGPDCGALTLILSHSLREMEVKIGDESSDYQPVPSFSDSGGFLEMDLCFLTLVL